MPYKWHVACSVVVHYWKMHYYCKCITIFVKWNALIFWAQKHTWASLQSWEGYPPPEFFLISTPPLQEGLSWAKYSPPRKNFWANYLKISPPRKNIFGKFQENSGILVKSCKGYPPLWGWKIYPPPKNFQKNIPPLWNFRNLSPPGSRVLAHVCLGWLCKWMSHNGLIHTLLICQRQSKQSQESQ